MRPSLEETERKQKELWQLLNHLNVCLHDKISVFFLVLETISTLCGSECFKAMLSVNLEKA